MSRRHFLKLFRLTKEKRTTIYSLLPASSPGSFVVKLLTRFYLAAVPPLHLSPVLPTPTSKSTTADALPRTFLKVLSITCFFFFKPTTLFTHQRQRLMHETVYYGISFPLKVPYGTEFTLPTFCGVSLDCLWTHQQSAKTSISEKSVRH